MRHCQRNDQNACKDRAIASNDLVVLWNVENLGEEQPAVDKGSDGRPGDDGALEDV